MTLIALKAGSGVGKNSSCAPRSLIEIKYPYAWAPLFLLLPDIMITSRHVIGKSSIDEVVFVAGFKTFVNGKSETQFSNVRVLHSKKIIYLPELDSYDLVLVRLKEKTEFYKPLTVNWNYEPTLLKSLYTIGHPLGVTLKYTTNGGASKMVNDIYFEANLDTYEGNSGSPVFDRKTHQVIGILTEGSSGLYQSLRMQPN